MLLTVAAAINLALWVLIALLVEDDLTPKLIIASMITLNLLALAL